MTLRKSLTYIYYLGMLLIVAGIFLQLTDAPHALIIFASGVFPFVGIRAYNTIIGQPENKRLHTILLVSGLFLIIAAIAIFLKKGYWIVFLLITAVLDMYTTFRKFT